MILLASLLKPANDIRMYEKLAKSLAKKTEIQGNKPQKIHIIGFKPKKEVQNTEVFAFYPIFDFKRLSYKRFFAQFLFFYFLLKIRPKILIVCTFELLFFSVIYKILFGGKLVYDVQENYFANICYTKVFPYWLKIPLAYLVLFWEKMCCFWVDEYWLAEKCYLEELNLYKKKYIFLENKVVFEQIKFLQQKNKTENQINFLISGTLGEDYGTYKAIDWCKHYHKTNSNIHLTIIGFCAKKLDLQKIKNNISNTPYITLIGGNILVNYNQIISKANNTDYWLMPYLQNENIKKRIPTKFYEAIALQKMIITTKNIFWKSFFEINNYNSFIFFEDILPNFVFEKQNNTQIMDIAQNPNIFWENEVKNLDRSVIFEKLSVF